MPDGDTPDRGVLYHSDALTNIRKAVEEWNDTSDAALGGVVCLGNLIENHGDSGAAQRDMDEVVSELSKCRLPVHYVLGNHDVYQATNT